MKQKAMRKPPWQLHREAKQLEGVTQQAEAARQACLCWGRRLQDAAEERRMESWLPAANGGSENGGGIGVSREAALHQVRFIMWPPGLRKAV